MLSDTVGGKNMWSYLEHSTDCTFLNWVFCSVYMTSLLLSRVIPDSTLVYGPLHSQNMYCKRGGADYCIVKLSMHALQ